MKVIQVSVATRSQGDSKVRVKVEAPGWGPDGSSLVRVIQWVNEFGEYDCLNEDT